MSGKVGLRNADGVRKGLVEAYKAALDQASWAEMTNYDGPIMDIREICLDYGVNEGQLVDAESSSFRRVQNDASI